MSRPVQAFVLVMLGAILVKLAVTKEYLNYVRPGLWPYLIAAGIVFGLLGAAGIVRDFRSTEARQAVERRRARTAERTHGPGAAAGPVPERGHVHDDWYGHGAGWLVCVPLFLLLVLPPPALGSYAAARTGGSAPAPGGRASYSGLPVAGPTELTVRDYAMRAVWDHGRTLAGHSVVLTGFVAASVGDVWYVSRLHIVCCAADAVPAAVAVVGSSRRYPANEWVAVTGTWTPCDPGELHGSVARIRASAVRPVARPVSPYE